MAVDRAALEGLGRDQLIREARRFGVKRPEVMTRVELVDEVLRLGTPSPVERKKVRGWLGVARDLVADLVEQGLNLPDAAALIRGDVKFEPLNPVEPPIATVTLAEIYGAQGHHRKAIAMLDEVLAKEPDHEAARKLHTRLERDRASKRARTTSEEVASVEERRAEPPLADAQPGALGLRGFADGGEERSEEYGGDAPAGISEYPEPLTSRRLSKQPPANDENRQVDAAQLDAPEAPPALTLEEPEPLTPRRLSRQPPAPLEPQQAAAQDEPEPLTPRRLSKQPPTPVEAQQAAAQDEPEPLTPRRLSKQPPAPVEAQQAAAQDEPEPLTPRRLSKQPPAPAGMSDEPEPLTPRRLSKQPPPAEPASAVAEVDAQLAALPPVIAEPLDDVAVVVRGESRAVVYYEIGEPGANGDAFLVHLAEWRPAPGGASRVEHEVPVASGRGTIAFDGLAPGSIVRAAVGRRRQGRFKPVSVAVEVALSSGEPETVWSPRPRHDFREPIRRAAAMLSPS